MPHSFHLIENEDDDFLCCCEYFNIKEQRSHLLGCCCDCEDVDEYFERTVTRTPVPMNIYHNMYRTFQDRCRIPWRGGAKTVPLDVLLPIVMQPCLALIAATNCWCTFAVFLALPFIVWYFTKLFESYNQSTIFFISWTLTSSALLLIVFEFLVVPQLEILPEENYFLVAFLICAVIFVYLTRNTPVKSMGEYTENEEEMSSLTERYCKTCRMKQPLRSIHCDICNCCVIKAEYHCLWLDCCIGGRNLSKFMLGLLFSVLALMYGSYLTLTTVCHPFLILDTLLIPDDCSDVFFDTYLALCFVAGSYSLLSAAVLVYVLLRHCWLIALGMTNAEWGQLSPSERQCFGFKTMRPHSQGALANFKDFISV